MTTLIQASNTTGSKLKAKNGWYAAGIEVRSALTILSDGAFKLFVYVSLQADRKAGRYEATQTELAQALGKSRRIIGKYIAELAKKGICSINPGKNQHSQNVFQILDDYWPYARSIYSDTDPGEDAEYVAEVRDRFLAIGCTRGTFGDSDQKTAGNFETTRCVD